MYGFLLTLMVLDGFFLAVVILLQAGKGGGLAAMGGGAAATDGLLAGRQATSMLTRATWGGGAAFMVLSLVLSIMSSRAQAPTSILQQDFQAEVPASSGAPVLPGLAADSSSAPAAEGAAPAPVAR